MKVLSALGVLSLTTSLALTHSALAQPANDDCAGAQPITEGVYDFDMTDATNSVQSACDAPGAGLVPDVWFVYTPIATGTATITTCDVLIYEPPPAVTLAAYDLCGGTQLGCAGSTCSFGQSTLTLSVIVGQPYLIRVASATTDFAHGFLAVRLRGSCEDSPPNAPPNDCCSGATPIGDGSWAFSTVHASRDFWSDGDASIDFNPDVWFDYLAPASGFVKLRPDADAPTDLSIAAFDGSCAGEQIACDCAPLYEGQTRQLVIRVFLGHHYLIRVRSLAQDPADAEITGHFSITPASAPANDDCDTAAPISGLGLFAYDNTIANNSGPDDQLVCDSVNGGAGIFQDVWFRWTGSVSPGEDLVISTVNSPQIETKIAVYEDHCAPGIALDCNDRVNPEFAQSEVVFTPTPGAAYLIRVGSRPNIGNEPPPQGRPGSFIISTQPTCTVVAPRGAFIEPEACGENINGGCDTGQFTDISCGATTIFGTAPVIDGIPDRDFYRAVLPVDTHVTFGGTAEFPFMLAIMDEQCNFQASSRYPYGPCNDPHENFLEADLVAGTYYFAIENSRPFAPCDRKVNYVLNVLIDACEPSGQCCLDGQCAVMPHSVCIGSGGAYAGDNTTCPPPGGNYVASECSAGLEDISATGAPGPACDDCGVVADLGFGFSFYGQDYTSLHISSNGFLTFDDETYDGSLPPLDPLPDQFDKAIIAPWWDDYTTEPGHGNVYTQTLGTAPNRRFVALWQGVENLGIPGAFSTFEVVLFEGSNQIAFRYGDLDHSSAPVVATTNGDGTVAATFDQSVLGSCATLSLTVAPNPCACRADFNGVGGVTVQDIFDFLSAWFSGDPRADINGGGLSVQDIFDFLSAWFAGC